MKCTTIPRIKHVKPNIISAYKECRTGMPTGIIIFEAFEEFSNML